MIGISTPLFDPAGSIRIEEMQNSETGDIARRVNRTPTLDGGVAINDRGYSAGDRYLRILWRPRNLAEYQYVQRLVRLYPRLNVATHEGVFVAAPQRISQRDGIGDLQMLVIEERT